jgi:hypothetical protein
VLGRRDLHVEAVDLDQLLDLPGPVRVPLTEITWPPGSVPRTVTRLRQSGLTASADRLTSTPRWEASSGAFT